MLAPLAAALSLASLLAGLPGLPGLTLDVPFLPQTDALCGGAAAAMVFRYWGDAHADVQQFARLVDRRAGGIADDVLVDAVRKRGWQALRVNGSIDELRTRLENRQPVIVLIADRRATYHYVVVTGVESDRVVVHDPSWGPSRSLDEREFVRVWKATHFWSLVILPTDTRRNTSAVATVASAGDDEKGNQVTDLCDVSVDEAIAQIHARGMAAADALLNGVRTRCPASAGPLRELAGLRFSQRRWSEAASFARQAVALDERDQYAWDVLGSSLFMKDDIVGALRAWNRIGKPRVNTVTIEGIRHARYQVIAEAIDIQPNTLLTAAAFERARRRLEDLPDRATVRLSLAPEADGFATVDVALAERPGRPHGAAEWTATTMRSAVDREVAVASPGFTGQGELWTACWRWWNDRPRIAFGFATPHVGHLPGVWRVDASWESQSYTLDASVPAAAIVRESRTHGGLTMSDWLTAGVRYSIGAGLDAWNADRKAAFVSGSLERRLLADRISASATITHWSALAAGGGFSSAGGQARFVSSPQPRRWRFRSAVGVDRVSDAAPLALWPGAGDGYARPALLRAHPMLDDGVIDARQSAFGRTLTYATAEAQRWFDRPLLPQVGLAGFVDTARATRGVAGSSTATHLDVGGGFRIRIPGADGVLRVDVAHGIRDGANALTVGWQY
jgi:predicted double-glycine peptidase